MKTAYINGIILDGTLDMEPQTGKVIIVQDKKIVAIEDADKADISGAKVIDLNNSYIMPGLINLHAHLPGTGKPSKKPMNLELVCKLITSCELGNRIGCNMVATNVKNALMAGVTTIRSVGGISNYDARVRDDIKMGKRVGPRILTSNTAISVPGGHMAGTFAYAAGNREEAVKLVDKIAESKADFIKLMITGGVMDSDEVGIPGAQLMPDDYIKAACDRAHELGLIVAAHCEGPAGIKAALKNGVDTIEHGAKPDEEMVELFKSTRASQIVTLTPALPYAERFEGMFNLSEAAVHNSAIVVEGMIELAKKNNEQGTRVGLGTDSSCSYATQYGVWRELGYYAKYCNVSNSFALHTGTLVNARIAGIDDITGSIETGKMADMIVTDKNPLEDIRALDDVRMVIFEGTLYDNPEVNKYPEVDGPMNALLD